MKNKKSILILVAAVVSVAAAIWVLNDYNQVSKKTYTPPALTQRDLAEASADSLFHRVVEVIIDADSAVYTQYYKAERMMPNPGYSNIWDNEGNIIDGVILSPIWGGDTVKVFTYSNGSLAISYGKKITREEKFKFRFLK